MKTAFENLITIYRAAEPALGDEVALTLSTADLVAVARSTLLLDPAETGVAVIKGDPDQLSLGETIQLSLTRPRKRFGLVVEDVNGLIKAARLEEPLFYFVRKENYFKGDPKTIGGLEAYRCALSFIDLLGDSAAYLNRKTEELVYIRGGKFSVPIDYCLEDISVEVCSSIEALAGMFAGDLHRPQKLEILSSAVFELTSSALPQDRFSLLLKGASDLRKKVEDGYRLFAASFSYEKIKSEIQDANIEFTGKIHKVFADIQSQMLGIPVATAIVATQMKYAKGFASQFWINTGILIGSLIFAVLTIALIFNQQNTLDVLEEEIGRRERTVAEKYEQLRDLLDEAFNTLRKRLSWQRRLLNGVGLVVLAGFVVTFVIYLHLVYLPS